MTAYIVTYDLHTVGQNYDCLYEKLKSYGTWCRIQDSVWVVVTTVTASQIRDHLATCLDGNDKLFVARLTGEAAWMAHSVEVSDWLKKNL